MIRSVLFGVLALTSVAAVGLIPMACQSGGVGDPCTPEEEYQAGFNGFDFKQLFIESSSFNCSTRLCLVNHFQGRVSCPLGQLRGGTATTKSGSVAECFGNDTPCNTAKGEKCTQADVYGPQCCLPGAKDCTAAACQGNTTCTAVGGDKTYGVCQCSQDAQINLINYHCDQSDHTLKTYVCHAPGKCQQQYPTAADPNDGKQCCVPGTDTPVSTTVCPQCKAGGNRAAANAVYCSCKCLGPHETAQANFNYCSCPSGYSCENLRPNIGFPTDAELNGSYCVKAGTVYDQATAGTTDCGSSLLQSQEVTGAGCGS